MAGLIFRAYHHVFCHKAMSHGLLALVFLYLASCAMAMGNDPQILDKALGEAPSKVPGMSMKLAQALVGQASWDLQTSSTQVGVVSEQPFSQEGGDLPLGLAPKIMLDALELRDMDINDVLKLLAQKGSLNVIAGKSITGRVTMYLQNVDVRDALIIILKANGLAYYEEYGVLQIMTAQEYEQLYGVKFGVVTKRRILRLQSISPDDAMAILNQAKSTLGKIVADNQSNTIMIEDVPSNIGYLERYARMIDAPLESRVYKLQHAQAEALGAKIQEMLSPKVGKVKFDALSNKLFIKDTTIKLDEIEKVIKQIDVSRETEVFDISYAKAEDVIKSIAPMLTKDIGRADADVRSNSVILTDIAPKIEQMRKVIRALDKDEKEVLIEARIIQINLDDKFKMGIDWKAIIPKFHDLTLDNTTHGFGLGDTVSPQSIVSIGTLDQSDYSAVLSAISSLGKSKVLSSPSIAVVNNQEAKILVGTTKPYVTTTTTTTASGPATTAETVNFIDVGVKLHVTPTVHDDGYITMKIKPEVSTATQSVMTSQKNEIPIVDTSEVDTTIRVKDGVTIIIGGLIKDEITDTRNKVPVLGDIPILGRAFSHINKGNTKTEIVIFLTPHIITGDVRSDPDQYTVPASR